MSVSRSESEPLIEIEVRFYSSLLRFSPGGSKTARLQVAKGSSINELLDFLEIPRTVVYLVLVNGKQAARELALTDGDEIALVPPVGGGSMKGQVRCGIRL